MMLFLGPSGGDPAYSASSGAFAVLSAWIAHRDLSQAALVVLTSTLITASTAVGLHDRIRGITKRMSWSTRVWSAAGLIAAVWLCATTFWVAGPADYNAYDACYAYSAGASTAC